MELVVKVRRPNGQLDDVELCMESCVAIGYAGRNQESVKAHVEELAKLGVPRPASIPSMYWIDPAAIRCVDRIHVVGEETSAEIEFFMAPDAEGRLYLTVVSDHSDRKLESVSVSKAKQICPKIIGAEFWALDDVRDHWDQLRFTCYAYLPEKTLYQEASVGSLLGWASLLDLARKDAPLSGPVSFCSGTVPVIGGELKYAKGWDIILTDPVLRRSISQHYDVVFLDDRN